MLQTQQCPPFHTSVMDPAWRAHSPGQQNTEPANASLFSLLLVHTGLQGQSHCSSQTLQSQSLNFAELGGCFTTLLASQSSFWLEQGHVWQANALFCERK